MQRYGQYPLKFKQFGNAGLGLGAGIIVSGKHTFLRSFPDTANSSYIVARNTIGGANAIHFQRNVGGAADASSVGAPWPEWRVTGVSQMSSFNGNPKSPTNVVINDIGAQDMVGANASNKFFGSFHGLGAGGALNSETLTIDGATFDPTGPAVYGSTFALRNSTTATDGTTIWTRDLTTSINGNGCPHYVVNSASGTALSFAYVGMASGTGNNFNEDDFKVTSTYNVAPLGTSDCRAYLAATRVTRMRDLVNGNQVIMTGIMPDIANYVRTEVIKEPSNNRTRAYLSRFSSVAALAGASWDLDIAVGATGAQFNSTQLLTTTDFTTGWSTVGTGVGVSAGVVTFTQPAAGNCRIHAAINTCASGSYYMMLIDMAGANPDQMSYLAGSNTNGSTTSPAPAFTQNLRASRNIQTFLATQTDPNQRFLFNMPPGASGYVATATGPGAYAVAL